MISSTLQPTYYDFIRAVRPYVIELAEQDADDLLARQLPPETIYSVDDYDSRFPKCVDVLDSEILAPGVRHTGKSVEQLKVLLGDMMPQARAQFASTYATVSQEYHSLVNFALSGKKTFHFGDNLSEHLANTEINVKAALIELPFPSCLFTFTSRSVIDAMHNIRGHDGRYGANTGRLDYSAPVSVFLTVVQDTAGLPGRSLVMTTWHARLPAESHLMLKRELYLGEDWTLEQALRTDWATLTPESCVPGLRIDEENSDRETLDDSTFYTDGLAFYRIVLNAILYLSSDKAELDSQKSPRVEMEAKAKNILAMYKRMKVLQTASRHSELDFQEVGKSVGAIVIQQSEHETTSLSTGIEGNKPLVRFMVRGHWRHQAHGAGQQDRKLIWIRPHYKGPDLAALINKPYLVR